MSTSTTLTRKQQLELWKQQRQSGKSIKATKSLPVTNPTAHTTKLYPSSFNSTIQNKNKPDTIYTKKSNTSVKSVTINHKSTHHKNIKSSVVPAHSSLLHQLPQSDDNNNNKENNYNRNLLQQPAKRVQSNISKSNVHKKLVKMTPEPSADDITNNLVESIPPPPQHQQSTTRKSQRNHVVGVSDISIDSCDSYHALSPPPATTIQQPTTANKLSVIKNKLTQSAIQQQQVQHNIIVTQPGNPLLSHQFSSVLSPAIDVNAVLHHIKTPRTAMLDTSLQSPDVSGITPIQAPTNNCLDVNESPISVNSPLVARKLVDVMDNDCDDNTIQTNQQHNISIQSDHSSFHIQSTPYNDDRIISNHAASPIPSIDVSYISHANTTVFDQVNDSTYIVKSPNIKKQLHVQHSSNGSNNNTSSVSSRRSSGRNSTGSHVHTGSQSDIALSSPNPIQVQSQSSTTSTNEPAVSSHPLPQTRRIGITGAAQRIATPAAAKHKSTNGTFNSTTTTNSSIIYASIRAHKSDAERLGSNTFMSPVRRSTRISSNESSNTVNHESQLQNILESNQYAYYPNTVLTNGKSGRKSRKSVKFNNTECSDNITSDDQPLTEPTNEPTTADDQCSYSTHITGSTGKRKSTSTSRKATPAIKRNKQSNAMNSNNNTNQLSDTIEYEFVKPAPRQPRMRRQSTTRQGTPAIRKTSSRRSHSDTIDVSVVTAAHTVSSKQTYGSNKNTPRPNRRK